MLALLLAVAAGAVASAHRRDEFLQAARVAIDPDRVQIELDLTPGTEVAEQVLADLDSDRNGSISRVEARAYSERLLAALDLDLDGMPLRLELADTAFPRPEAVWHGEGTVRIQAAAVLPALAAGPHRLRYRNAFRSDIGAYLANTLVPTSDRIALVKQRRDPEQRELVVEYTLRASPAARGQGLLLSVAGVLVLAVNLWWRLRPVEAS